MSEKIVCYIIKVIFLYKDQAARDLRRLGFTDIRFTEVSYLVNGIYETYDSGAYLLCTPSQARGIREAKPYWLINIDKYYSLLLSVVYR